jgi:hypothetical protein
LAETNLRKNGRNKFKKEWQKKKVERMADTNLTNIGRNNF